jgi:ribosomal protein S27AE
MNRHHKYYQIQDSSIFKKSKNFCQGEWCNFKSILKFAESGHSLQYVLFFIFLLHAMHKVR